MLRLDRAKTIVKGRTSIDFKYEQNQALNSEGKIDCSESLRLKK